MWYAFSSNSSCCLWYALIFASSTSRRRPSFFHLSPTSFPDSNCRSLSETLPAFTAIEKYILQVNHKKGRANVNIFAVSKLYRAREGRHYFKSPRIMKIFFYSPAYFLADEAYTQNINNNTFHGTRTSCCRGWTVLQRRRTCQEKYSKTYL